MSNSLTDEFGPSLDDMFPSLDDDMPALESEALPKPGFTETHLVTLFSVRDCAICHSQTRVAINYAVRRVHSTRNACIEYQTILPGMYALYDHLPKAYKDFIQSDPFCLTCANKAKFTLNVDFL